MSQAGSSVDVSRWAALPLPLFAALGIACGVTVLLITVFNYLVLPISADLALTRAETAGAISTHLAVLVVALPVAGALADRFGARPVIVVSALLFGAALLWIAHITGGRRDLYLAFGLAGIAGAGASPIAYARVLVHRFDARRGLALGVALSGTGLGGIILPALVRPVVVAHGWRSGMELLALIATGVGVIAGLLMGSEVRTARVHAPDDKSLRSAAATGAFWKMALAFGLLAIVLAGVTAHLTEIWQAFHWDSAGVPAFQATVGIATIVGRLLGGALMDGIPAKFVGAAAAICGAAGIGLLAVGAQSHLALLVVGAAIGICTGTESDVVSYLASRYFGIMNFSRIYAAIGAFFMIGFALGPILAAKAFERSGINSTLIGGALVLCVSALSLVLLPRQPPRLGT